jgi:acetyl esterase
MPLDPFLEPLLQTLPPMAEEVDDFPAHRAQEEAATAAYAEQLAEPGPRVDGVSEVSIPLDGAAIDVRIYRPAGVGPHPAHLYVHGGGFTTWTIRNKFVDITCRERCAGAQCVVVSVDYRKAPEHKFPIGLNDVYAAVLWVGEHAAQLDIRPDLITIGGGSAGANLAAAVALKVRDEGGPKLTFQLLEAPPLDLTLSLPSYQTLGTGYGLTLGGIEANVRYYLSAPEEATNPYVSPLLAPDLSGLPPAHIMAGEYDPLRDDGEEYAKRLNKARVPATFSLQLGHIHVSPALTKVMAISRQWRAELIDQLRRAHER